MVISHPVTRETVKMWWWQEKRTSHERLRNVRKMESTTEYHISYANAGLTIAS